MTVSVITCREVVDHLSAFVDGEISPALADVILVHLRTCGECRARLTLEQSVKAVVARACTIPVAPERLRERVQATLQQTRVGYSYTQVTRNREGTTVIQVSGFTEVTSGRPEPAVGRLRFTVGEADTAEALGSGEVAVLGTPRLIAWCEQACLASLAGRLSATETTVGVHVDLEHLAPSRPGSTVEVTAVLVATGRRRLTFDCEAIEPDTAVVLARGRLTRVRVLRAAFG